MKKTLFISVVILCISVATNAMDKNGNMYLCTQHHPITAEASGKFEIFVKANAAVDDLCNYFNGSWLNTGLKVYCSFGGDVYTCTTYKVVQAACTVNGAVRLIIEGDYNNALKRIIDGGVQLAKIYTVSKVAGNYYIK